jgi:DNA repair exonuclease SbcCD ATPase subunit
MIEFKYIKVANFCSYGNHPTTIELDKHEKTLVVGKNGRGKSTILLDGIFFSLFGKPYRKVTKTQLINSRNKGDTMTEICFLTRGSTYVVRRGIKPNIFDITVDGIKLDNNVMNKDLQEYLEQDILQLNIRTFGQTVVLGSTSYVPFMQLDAAKRREVVDDVLNVGIYTKMGKLAKEDLDITNKALSKVMAELDVLKASFQGQKRLIEMMESNQQDAILNQEEDLSRLKDKHQALLIELAGVDNKQAELPKVSDPRVAEARERVRSLTRQIDTISKKIDDFDSITSCPTCFQKVDDAHKHSIKEKSTPKLDSLRADLSLAEESCQIAEADDVIYKCVLETASLLKASKNSVERSIREVLSDISALEERINKAKSVSSSAIEDERTKLKIMSLEGKDLGKKISELKETKAIQELSVSLLKDSGIKARIIREYIPVLNSLINKYLKGYDFDIRFELDENFDEQIKSQGRENFSYNSFSEGEKERIDYSIMLALRKLASAKNAAHLNILVLDEILDGSLDSDARSYTLDMLASDMDKSNIFVISHTEAHPSYYDSILKVDKKGHFSFIVEEEGI